MEEDESIANQNPEDINDSNLNENKEKLIEKKKFLIKVLLSIVVFLVILIITGIIWIFVFSKKKEYIPINYYGIVEGFYGVPWNYEIRADMLKFCAEYKFNAYIYAPKDDSYHRDKQRVPYPNNKLDEPKMLIYLCNENKVKFILVVSPGLDLNFKGEE